MLVRMQRGLLTIRVIDKIERANFNEVHNLQKSLEEGAVLLSREDESVNLADSNTSMVVTIIDSRVPSNNSGSSTDLCP